MKGKELKGKGVSEEGGLRAEKEGGVVREDRGEGAKFLISMW